MADTITIPATGSGSATPVVATDDAGAGGHVQIIKLAISADGSATVIPADATNGLDVDVTRVADGADVSLGAIADAAVAAGATGSVQAKLRRLTTDLDAVKTAVQLLDDAIAGTEMQVDVVAALPAGTNAIGKLAANSGVDIGDVDVLSIAAGTNLIGGVNVRPGTSGGLTISRVISAASTNATSVKGSAGQVYGWYLFNANAATRYLKLYNKASAPTVGTDTPVLTIPIPGGSAANVEFTNGIPFATGIALALTTGVADSDTGAVAANEIVVNLLYA